jgi:hypothetical protein
MFGMKIKLLACAMTVGLAFGAQAQPRTPASNQPSACERGGPPMLTRSAGPMIDATLLPKAADCCRGLGGCAQLLSTTKLDMPRRPART